MNDALRAHREPRSCTPLGRWPITSDQLKKHIADCHPMQVIADAYGVSHNAVYWLAQKYDLALALDRPRRR
jgi:hypothetical protein